MAPARGTVAPARGGTVAPPRPPMVPPMVPATVPAMVPPIVPPTERGPHRLGLRGPHSKVWKAVVAGLGIFVLLAVCGLTSYFIVVDEQAGNDAKANGANAGPSILPRDISSREKDAAPLSVEEVFPGKEVTIVAGQPAYPVLATQLSGDCRVAATETLLQQITAAGCNQAARATLRSPSAPYLVTAGILNLATVEGADKVHESVKGIVDAKKGRFTGLVAGKGTEPIVRSATHLGWDSRGHFLIYCVIARADGKEFTPADDPHARQIIYDMIVLHLRNTVLEKRATIQVGATPATSG